MRLRRRLDRVKWCGALGVALVLHAAVFWSLRPQAFPPPLVQPASTRVLLISFPPLEPAIIEEARTHESPPKVVESSTPLVAEASPVEVEVNEPEPERKLVPDPPSEPDREPVQLAKERVIEPERERESGVVQPSIDKTVGEEASVPANDSVLAAEDDADVDGLFDVPPRALKAIEPNYPLSERRKKHEGDVLCEAVITNRGRVESVRIVLSSGYQKLDHAALAALRRARFEPAVRRDRSIEATVRITIAFRLTGR